jgi:DMSO reductase anchor subunit
MTDAALPPAAVHSRRASGYLLLGLLASFMPEPYNLVAVVPLVAAVVEHVLVLRALRTAEVPRVTRTWTVFGMGITLLLLGSLLMPYATLSSRDYRECMAGANTQLAEQDCAKRFR